MRILWRALAVPFFLPSVCRAAAAAGRLLSNETFHQRNYFFVGGEYRDVNQPVLGNGTVMTDQMYVEELIPPVISQPYPLVMWSGGGQTGANFLNTPDGREGWASYFLRQGWLVYVVDQPQRGRSSWYESDGVTADLTIGYVQKFFTAVENYGLWNLSVLHTQWPGTGMQGDPVFDRFFASQVQLQLNMTMSEINNRMAGAALLDRIGPAFLLTHSQAGPYGWGVGELRPELVRGIVAIEPEGPPFVNEITATGHGRPYGVSSQPLTYDPPFPDRPPNIPHVTVAAPPGRNLSSCEQQAEPAHRLVNLSRFPVLVVTSEAGYHAQYDYCTVRYLEQAGVDVQWLNLPAVGIRGNSHFVFLEKNSLEIASLVQNWLASAGGKGQSRAPWWWSSSSSHEEESDDD